jgi:uncharacterized membrane protein
MALAMHPTPWCVDCEYRNPWGHVSDRIDDVLAAWSLIAPFIAGLLSFRKGWLVPIFVVIATLITQPLGGVAWWSLRENEGPMIMIIGLPVCTFCFGLGRIIHLLFEVRPPSSSVQA